MVESKIIKSMKLAKIKLIVNQMKSMNELQMVLLKYYGHFQCYKLVVDWQQVMFWLLDLDLHCFPRMELVI
jgi:hypothetical protein